MAKIKYKALKMGYVDHKRVREGEIFLMEESFLKYDKDGEQIAPKWCVPLKEKKMEKKPEEKIELPPVTSDEVI